MTKILGLLLALIVLLMMRILRLMPIMVLIGAQNMHSWLNKLKQKLSLTRILQGLLALYAIYLLLAYFAVNPIAQKLLPKIANDNFASVARVGKVSFDPLRLIATIDDFALSNQDADPLIQFETLIVDFDISGMFKRAWQFKQIALIGPEVNVSVNERGNLNWQSLMDQLNKDPSPKTNKIARLIIDQIGLAKGKLIYADQSKETPINMTLTPLGFQLKGFSTLPQDRGDYLIAAVFAEDGGRLRWKGDMGVNPIASKGSLSLEGVHLANMLELVQGLSLPLTLSSGDIHAEFDYQFSMPKSVADLQISNFNISLDALSGELQGGQSLSLSHTSLQSPTVHFINNKQPELHIAQLAYQLESLQFKQANQMQFILKKTNASLPQLDLIMAETPEMDFDQLNITLSGMTYQQGEQFSVTLPTLEADNIHYQLADNQLGVSQVKLTDINLFDKSTLANDAKPKPLAKLNSLSIEESMIALNDKKINLERLSLTGFDTSVVRNQQGELNWVEMFAKEAASESEPSTDLQNTAEMQTSVDSTTAEDSKQAETSWGLQLNAIALNDANIRISDHTTPKPVILDIVKASAEINNASLDLSKPLPVKAAFNIKQGGQFKANGQLWPSPFKSNMNLHLSNLSLKPLAPYVNQLALLELKNGAADLSGRIKMQQKQQFAMAFNGGFNVKKLALVEEENDVRFLSWDAVKSKDVALTLSPDKLHIGTLALVQPDSKFIINADKTLNVQQILRSAHEPLKTATAPNVQQEAAGKDTEMSTGTVTDQPTDSLIQPVGSPKISEQNTSANVDEIKVSATQETPPSFPVLIDRVVLQDAKLEFADLSLITPFGTKIHALNGVLNGLSTQAGKVAQVELDGKVDEYGSARIRGALQPFQATEFTDITLAFTNLDMSKLTPYSGKFAGRRIEAGKLSVDLGYKIKDKQLIGDNKFVVNKIKLGEKVDSPEAKDLPLDLAIAILEDSDGVIDLALPIKGSLADPEFSYSSIVWKALRNVLTKIVTAPFKALGKLFGGEGEKFDGITFEAGLSDISPQELEKLVKISDVLSKRKSLSLGIKPLYDKQLDKDAIKQTNYRQQVAEVMDIELLEGQKAGPVDLDNEKAQKAIIKLHDKLTKKGFFKKLTDKFDQPEPEYFKKAQAALIDSIKVANQDLIQLAQARGEAIVNTLTQQGVAENRLELLKPESATNSDQVINTTLTLNLKKAGVKEQVQAEPTEEIHSKEEAPPPT